MTETKKATTKKVKESSYPRVLYAKGWSDVNAVCVCNNADEEDTARADGYKDIEEFPAFPEDKSDLV